MQALPLITHSSYSISEDGQVYRNGSVVKGCNTYGYLSVDLCQNNIKKTYRVHRLVAQAFIPNPENKPQVNHINGIKTDNRVENLEWCTAKENSQHALSTGLAKPHYGEIHSKLTEPQVREIWSLLSLGAKPAHIAPLFGVKRQTVNGIRSGEKWKHLNLAK